MVVADHCLITGPSRGGKSEWAETLAASMAGQGAVTYLATGMAPSSSDPAWQERIDRHQRRRPGAWLLYELTDPLNLPGLLSAASPLAEQLVLLDSLGSWVAALLDLDELAWQHQQNCLLSSLRERRTAVVLVAEEVGWGVVPPTAIGGLFRDRLGQLVRRCADLCPHRWLVLAGDALPLHQLAQRVPNLD
jgi:adenosylcobinamide kinase/adenosylcobinamide-phosphate guanylyltransferase